MRNISEVEMKTLDAFEAQELPKGFINSVEVGQAMLTYIGDNAVTVQSLAQATQALIQAGWKVYRSQAQTLYDQLFSALDAEKHNLFARFWNAPSTKRAILQDGEDGFHNGAALLTAMRGHPWTYESLVYVMQRAGNSGHLHYAPVKSERQLGQYSGRDIPDPPTNRTYSQIMKDAQAPREEVSKPTEPSLDASEARWKQMAEGVQGNTHSETAAIRAITKQPGQSWRNVYEARRTRADRQPPLVSAR
jgi:hypothetical protein